MTMSDMKAMMYRFSINMRVDMRNDMIALEERINIKIIIILKSSLSAPQITS